MKFDYKALQCESSERTSSISAQIVQNFWSTDIAKRNNLLAEAIEMATGKQPGTLPRLNPYDFVKRLTKTVAADGEIIRLDGRPILFLGLTSISYTGNAPDQTIQGTFPYRNLVEVA